MALDPARQVFIDQYMIDFNGTRAAKEAGFKDTSAPWRLLRENDVRDEIDRRLAVRRAQARITIEHVENLLRDIAEVEVLDIFTETGEIRPLTEMPPHARRAIKSIKRTEEEHFVSGKVKTVIHVELWDKKGAIELLGKYKKMFTDKVELEGTIKQKVAFTINGMGTVK